MGSVTKNVKKMVTINFFIYGNYCDHFSEVQSKDHRTFSMIFFLLSVCSGLFIIFYLRVYLLETFI
jgi:hypothetical protein